MVWSLLLGYWCLQKLIFLFMLTFIVFIIILGLLIFAHEFGHFIVARRCGVKVEEFAFGFPPTLWKKEYKGTVYKINLLPIGGYVKMLGEDKKINNPHAFSSQKARKKLLIVIAGVVLNIVLAYIFLVTGYLIGMSPVAINPDTLGGHQTKQIIVSTVEDNSPAFGAGIKPGDLIDNFASAEEFAQFTNSNRGKTVALSISRGQSTQEVNIGLREDPDKLSLGVGLGGQGTKVRLGHGGALVAAAREVWSFTVLAGEFIWNLITSLFGKGSLAESAKGVAGPVGIYSFTDQAVKLGFVYIIQWLAILSLNFGLINILPFPALDGGRAVFILLEGIVRKKVVREEVEGIIHMIGFVLLIALLIAVTYREIFFMVTK